jgi:hypothetical protein
MKPKRCVRHSSLSAVGLKNNSTRNGSFFFNPYMWTPAPWVRWFTNLLRLGWPETPGSKADSCVAAMWTCFCCCGVPSVSFANVQWVWQLGPNLIECIFFFLHNISVFPVEPGLGANPHIRRHWRQPADPSWSLQCSLSYKWTSLWSKHISAWFG